MAQRIDAEERHAPQHHEPEHRARVQGSIFTIPPGQPFLMTLARAVLSGTLPRPGGKPPADLALSDMTILLPTRRAARALQEAFLEAAAGRALLLPRIRPIAEGDEDLSLLAALTSAAAPSPGGADIPPAIGEVERQLVLTSLVQRWSEAMHRHGAEAADDEPGALAVGAGAGTAAQAAGLARELARLIDLVETEEVELGGIKTIVHRDFSEHWQKTLDFLEIVLDWWPAHLADRKLLSPMDRRNRLVRAEAARLAAAPPAGPVIVAGVTGSIPATAELMRVVAGLPGGALVLPGLDLDLDPESWRAIAPAHPEHPHFTMLRLLERLGVVREDVPVLPGAETERAIAVRSRLVSEAMRPAITTERWHTFTSAADRGAIRAALAGVSLIAAPTPEDEAEAIALILREVAETPRRTAALVTRDRLLARRVAVRLEAWGIQVDDSAGRPLAKTMPGAFLDLVIAAVASAFEPSALVALLTHPLTRLGLPAREVRSAARALEIAVFRTLYLGRGLDGIDAALEEADRQVAQEERRGRAVLNLSQQRWSEARDLVQRLRAAYAPLLPLFEAAGRRHRLRDLAHAHVVAAEALAALPAGDTARGLWAEATGEAASLFLMGLVEEDQQPLELPAREYPDLFRGLIGGETVRPVIPLHPRLSIWGPLEARLQQPDVVVIGSLNEGTWPEQVDPGPWLNRPMRKALGLPSPEERIGHAAHDFTMLMGAPTVYLTRSLKVDGVPAVASRWLLRLEALLQALDLTGALAPRQPWLAWAAWRNRIVERPPQTAPEPCPPVALRPRRLSVSAVETWISNPYAIFARHILRLEPMPAIGGEPDAAVRGGIIHAALSAFAKAFPADLPAGTAAELMRLARLELEALTDNARVAAFWLPRLERFADWFAATEPARRLGVGATHTEVRGELDLMGPAGLFKLTARADRIDVRPDGTVITDYKLTANLAKLRRDAESGHAPQLALEAMIALAGGFGPAVAADRIAAMRYISASGAEPPGAEIDVRGEDLGRLAAEARTGLERLIALYDREDTPYRAVRRARFSYDYDDYAHLARAAEWAGSGDAATEAE